MNTESRHLSNDELERFSGQKMPPAELLAADKHLGECEVCQAQLNELRPLDDQLLAANQAFSFTVEPEGAHLTYEQMAALVDHQLSDIDREIAQSHVEFCMSCERELRELSHFVEHLPDTALPRPIPLHKPSLQEKFLAFWQPSRFRLAAFALLAIVALVVLTSLLLLPLRRENARLREQLAELENRNEELRAQAAELENLHNEIATLREENHSLAGNASSAELKPFELNDGGGRITLDESGNLAGITTTPATEKLIKETLQSGRVKITTPLTGANGKSGTLMGKSTSSTLRLLAPINIVIETDHPLFQWQGLSGLATFKVGIFDENLNKIAESESLNTNQWKATMGLRRGQTYIWQVRASANNQELVAPAPDEPRIKFKVLEQAKVEALENAKKTNAKSHLILGILYADAGLLGDAEREFNALLRANPQSGVARRLLQSVKAAKR